MKLAKHLFPLLVIGIAMAALRSSAGNITKADNNTSLDQGGSWTGGNAPAATDVATWDNTVATAANCTNVLSADANWAGLEILNPAAPVEIDGGGGTLSIGGSGIDLSEAGTAQSLFLNLPFNTVADQAWTTKAGQTVTFGNNGSITNNVTLDGTVNCNNGFGINAGATLTVNSGVFTLVTNYLSPKPLTVGGDAVGGTVTQNGGAVNVSVGNGTSGSYQSSLSIGNSSSSTCVGTYNLNGGTLTDITSNTYAFCTVGNSMNATGLLNINGGTAFFHSLRIGNSEGTGFVNVSNGTLTVVQGEFSIGRGTTAGATGSQDGGTMNVYGGTVTTPGIGVNLPHGNGPGALNIYGGAFNIGNSLSVVQGSTGNGTLNMYGGVLTITNNLNMPGGGSGLATVSLNGGVVSLGAIVAGKNTGTAVLELNGGTLKARSGSANFIAATNTLTVNVEAGGAIIDTTNVNVTIPATLLNGTGGGADGGLTKLGRGALTLAAVNSYNGPTIVGEGTLVLSTTNNNTLGALTVSNAATLDTGLAGAGTSLNCSSFVEGAGPGDNETNQFDLGNQGNPTAPVINASSLTVNGTVYVIVNGSGFTLGTIPLIKYNGSVGGSGTFSLKLLAGAAGYVTNDTTAQSINVVITSFPELTWRAQVDTNWDLATANWVDTNGVTTLYVDGATTFFDDSANNTMVGVAGAFSPASVNFNNVISNYVFSGPGSIGGTASLTKLGAGTVVMALTNNSYSGDTVISNGVFELGVKNAVPGGSGKGNVTLEGKLDLAGFNEAINGLNGSNGVIDNSGVGPAVLSVGNNNGVGVFAGQITNSGGSLAVNDVGGSLTLLAANGYSGGTTNSGNLTLGVAQSIGTGPLTLNGGTLAWTDATAHTLTNLMALGGSVTFGTTANGPLTVGPTVNLNGGGRGITCDSDVAFINGITNGSISTKSGPGTLTLNSTSVEWTGSPQVSQGALVLDGASVTVNNGNVRVQCTIDGGLSRLAITNGGSLVLSNDVSQNLKVGANDTSGGDACTNILDVAGTVNLIPYPASSGVGGVVLIGGSSGHHDAADIVNLLPGGILRVRQITNSAPSPTSRIFNFNGGTLVPSTNDLAYDFLDGTIFDGANSGVNVLDGGAVIDTAGYTGITINNDLLAGGNGTGGLTKNGAGQLILAGSILGTPSTYGGATVVNAGTLTIMVSVPYSTNFFVAAGATLDPGFLELTSGKAVGGGGTVLGSITVDSGATVDPGTSNAVGTLTFDNAPALSGVTLLKLDKSGSTIANDQVAVSNGTLNYGGTLVVTNIGSMPASGDKFYLFNAPGGYSGSFASVTLPSLPAGLGWTDNFAGDGSLTVTGAVAAASIPQFNSVVLNNGNLILSGTNGTASTSYRVFATTNLTLPFASWTAIATNNFDGSGNFRFTNAVDSAKPTWFFKILAP